MKLNNLPPSRPSINGPQGGKPGITYTFNFNAIDPDGDNVSYYVEWGDGESDGWTPYRWSGTNVPLSHKWDSISEYPIRAKARDIHEAEGNWSHRIIYIHKDKTLNFHLNIFEWLLNYLLLTYPKY